jgi:hypothetical protein
MIMLEVFHMSQNSDKKLVVKTEEIKKESHSIWTLPSEKWSNPLSGKTLSFSDDLVALKEHMETFKSKLKAFETPVSIESLNYIVK